jgi:hypothetical protein
VELLGLQFFAPLVGKVFHVSAGVDLVLTRVTPLPPPRQIDRASGKAIPADRLQARLEPFSLLFQGPPDKLLPQAIHRLTPEGGEPLEIFLVPIGREEKALTYEAVFG